MQWSTTSQQAQGHGVKLMVYAEAGAGKTVLCATAPKPVILSAESGLLSLQRANIERIFGVNQPHISYDIPVLKIKTVMDLTHAFNWFNNPANRAREHFSTICIDSLSEIVEVVLANAKQQVKDPRQAYGEMLEQTIDAVKKFRDLQGFNLYMSAKMEPMKDEMTGLTRYWPAMPGRKLGPQLPYLFDEVFRLGVGKTQDGQKYRFLQTDQDMQYIAKDRSGRLEELEPADLTHVFNKILGAAA